MNKAQAQKMHCVGRTHMQCAKTEEPVALPEALTPITWPRNIYHNIRPESAPEPVLEPMLEMTGGSSSVVPCGICTGRVSSNGWCGFLDKGVSDVSDVDGFGRCQLPKFPVTPDMLIPILYPTGVMCETVYWYAPVGQHATLSASPRHHQVHVRRRLHGSARAFDERHHVSHFAWGNCLLILLGLAAAVASEAVVCMVLMRRLRNS